MLIFLIFESFVTFLLYVNKLTNTHIVKFNLTKFTCNKMKISFDALGDFEFC